MPPPSKQQKKTAVELKIAPAVPNFRVQMVYDAFYVERLSSGGVLLKFAYTGSSDIVSLLVGSDGHRNFLESAKSYLEEMGEIEPEAPLPLHSSRQLPPMFSNHIHVSSSGDMGEVSFYVVPLHDIALQLRNPDKVSPIQPVQVAMLHADLETHKQFVVSFFAA